MEQQTSSKLGKENVKAIYCHPVSLFLCRVHHAKCWAGWITSWNQDYQEKYQQPQICRWYHTKAESKEELKSLLMRVKEESEMAGLKLNIGKTKIMASGCIISWQIDGEKVETVKDFIFMGSRIIIAESDCSHEIKRRLGRKLCQTETAY